MPTLAACKSILRIVGWYWQTCHGSDKVPALTDPPEGYASWLADLKGRIHAAQQRAALAVNTELLRLYWQIGRGILDHQAEQGWGGKVVERTGLPLPIGTELRRPRGQRLLTSWVRRSVVPNPVEQDAVPAPPVIDAAG